MIGKPFKKGNKGKPKGAVNKTNRLVKEVVSEVFNDLQKDANAKYNLKNWAKANPKEFYIIAAKLIPVQMEHTGDLVVNWHEELTYETEPQTDKSH